MSDRPPHEEHQAPGPRNTATAGGSASSPTGGNGRPDSCESLPGTRGPLPERPGQQFASTIEPLLIAESQGRLDDLRWFRTDWQRGGALTGYARWKDEHGRTHDVVAKLPVPPRERSWLLRLQPFDNVVPRLFGHGDVLGGYDLVWVVMERLPHGPLGQHWNGHEFDLLIEAAGRFYQAAASVPVAQPPPEKDWNRVLDLARQNVRRHSLHHEQRWQQALKKCHKKLADWLKVWHDRPVDQWCHGDLHLANAMTRTPAPEGPAVLLDFALAHPGCWIEDAVYFEHLFWARPQRLGDRRLCRQLAHERRRLGLPVGDDWARLASVRRALLAMSTPAALDQDGDPHHVEAALKVLEIEVGN